MTIEFAIYTAGILVIAIGYGALLSTDDRHLSYAGLLLIAIWAWPVLVPLAMAVLVGFAVALWIKDNPQPNQGAGDQAADAE